MQKNYYRITLIVILGALLLGACGTKASNATPTSTPLSVEAISTAAAQTVIAQLTLEAPTITPTPLATNTPVATATSSTPVPTSTRPVPTASSCANLQFISDVTIPDGTQMPVNENFTKTWRVQNTGTCTWTTNFKLVFVRGDQMGGVNTELATAVPTGQKVDLSVALKVPNKSGKLTGVWSLMDDKGQYFGPVLTVVINVGAITPTVTGSATVTPTTEVIVPTVTPTETATTSP